MNSDELVVPGENEPRRALDREVSAAGRSSISILAMLQRSSPLPSPEQLAAYPPEGRELIYRLAQATQTHLHRVELERLELRREKLRARAIDRAAQRRQIARGQYLGFGICVLFLAASAAVALLATSGWGQLTASLLGGIGLSSLVFAFIRGQQPRASRRLRLRAPARAATQSN
ncbi:hypothetical protein [Nannocystis punicea]|uniref:DUF2335 domain-containing protein n=1 Tax=Nannocystis punicea TaxID=2995304 RepID=A0ABY7H1F7_9BACT|nr:hypothetical protein [Nannocystis poenicansa]WAS93086.1 hypothetical protein O0S08_43545 [Nannocystis poenicansa]